MIRNWEDLGKLEGRSPVGMVTVTAMNSELWRRVEDTFYAALDQPETIREQWLVQTCGGDAELLTEVRAMLEADSAGGLGLEKEIRRTAASLLLNTFGTPRE
jgi:hypothetical protein